MTDAAALLDRDAVETDAGAVEPQRRRRLLKRLAVRDAVVDRHAAEADRPLVLAGQMEFAGQQARHRISSISNACRRLSRSRRDDAEARVDLLAAVVARVAEREQAVGVDLRIAEPDAAGA